MDARFERESQVTAKYFAISCDDENGALLSNRRTLDLWQALETLLDVLSNSSFRQTLPSWKKDPHYKATARDAYAWRAAIEEIKNNDLTEKCSSAKLESSARTLVTDKPAMLKIASEVTNAMLHSYTRGHSVTFGLSATQSDSKVPS